jgi:hypothetical protein
MARWTRLSDFWIDLPDRPGELARLTAQLREADVNLLGMWGYGAENGIARFYCVPESPEQFRNFARSAELQVREGATFYLSGSDRGGTLLQTLEQIAAAKINLLAIQAVAIDGRFGCFLWANPEDWPELERLLR